MLATTLSTGGSVMIFTVIFAVVFFLVICFIPVSIHIKKKNNRCSATTRGILEDIQHTENSHGGGGLKYIYSYSVNGVEYRRAAGPSTEAHNTGDSCTLWYNPNNPKEVVAYHYKSDKGLNILMVKGIVMVFLCVALLVVGHFITTQVADTSDVANDTASFTDAEMEDYIAGTWEADGYSAIDNGETKNSNELITVIFEDTGNVNYSAESGDTKTGTWEYGDEVIIITFSDGFELHGTIEDKKMSLSGSSDHYMMAMSLKKQ